MGPSPINSLTGARFFVLFVDDLVEILGCIYFKTKVIFLQPLFISKQWLKINLIVLLKLFKPIGVESFVLCPSFQLFMVFIIAFLALILLSRMVKLRGRIACC